MIMMQMTIQRILNNIVNDDKNDDKNDMILLWSKGGVRPEVIFNKYLKIKITCISIWLFRFFHVPVC